MQLVAGVGELDHVGYRLRGELHVAFGEQISLLMLVLEKAAR
jgi:hypothetical protein